MSRRPDRQAQGRSAARRDDQPRPRPQPKKHRRPADKTRTPSAAAPTPAASPSGGMTTPRGEPRHRFAIDPVLLAALPSAGLSKELARLSLILMAYTSNRFTAQEEEMFPHAWFAVTTGLPTTIAEALSRPDEDDLHRLAQDCARDLGQLTGFFYEKHPDLTPGSR